MNPATWTDDKRGRGRPFLCIDELRYACLVPGRVNHEYIDFLHATIKRMKMSEINDTPGLFEAQRRCSDLNSAVYKYYDNIKKAS